MRAREEEKLRREDARKLKRLREDHLDEYLKLQEEKLKKEAISKKMKLNLPEPMLKEHELVRRTLQPMRCEALYA